jgi:hypothetical protein
MVMHICHSTTWEAEYKFEASVGHIARPNLRKRKTTTTKNPVKLFYKIAMYFVFPTWNV